MKACWFRSSRSETVYGLGRLDRVVMLSLVWPVLAAAQGQGVGDTARALVFDRVTVVDVEHGKLLPDQRVVVRSHRILAVGSRGAVRLPVGALVVEAEGQYLIPGLWDMHAHPFTDRAYLRYVAMGVTGIRHLQTRVGLDTLSQWRREILTGRRVGPPRQILAGPKLEGGLRECGRKDDAYNVCLGDTARARVVVDSLQAAGADMLKMYELSAPMYFAVAAEARRRHISFGGHLEAVAALDASDSGARIVDHLRPPGEPTDASGGLAALCYNQLASVASCRSAAVRFRRNGTWFVPTLFISVADQSGQGLARRAVPIVEYARRLRDQGNALWTGGLFNGHNWLRDSIRVAATSTTARGAREVDSLAPRGGLLALIERVSLPLAAGTDDGFGTYGWGLHVELATYVAEGLSPLPALQSATLNPALLLHATDSLGTVAPGKLADLVLLSANPLADITNTTTIRAVVANGRYYDRAALDTLLVQAQEK